MTAFQPPGVSRFNRLAEGDVSNAFLGGFLVLLILVELSNICDTLMYRKAYLEKSTLDRYIIFRRISSMRGFLRLLTGCEWSLNPVHTRPPEIHSYRDGNHFTEPPGVDVGASKPGLFAKLRNRRHSDESMGLPHVEKNYKKMLLPAVVRVLLLVVEFVAIYAGTTVRSTVTTASSLDPKIGLRAKPVTQTYQTGCDNYFVPARGQEEGGEVLKCVSRSTADVPPAGSVQNDTEIQLRINSNDNTAFFEVRTGLSLYQRTRVAVDISINTIGRGELGIAMVRPDVNLNSTFDVFNSVMNGVLKILSLEQNSNTNTTSSVLEGTWDITYKATLDKSRSEIADALVSQLRAMDLELNSTGPPWAFQREGTYERRGDAAVAVLGLNRVAHGTLMIVAAALMALRFFVNYFFTAFDELAYIGIKEIIGDDCIMGPTAGNPRAVARVVKLQKFSDGNTGHIGFRAGANQEPVEDFLEREVVVGLAAV